MACLLLSSSELEPKEYFLGLDLAVRGLMGCTPPSSSPSSSKLSPLGLVPGSKLAMPAMALGPPITSLRPLNAAGGGACAVGGAAAAIAGDRGPGMTFTLGTMGFFRVYFRLVAVGSFKGFFLGRPLFRLGGSVSPSRKKFWAPPYEKGPPGEPGIGPPGPPIA